MTSKQNFELFLNKNNLVAEVVSATFPYAYNNNKAYLVTFQGITQYFYFREDGKLLARNIIKG